MSGEEADNYKLGNSHQHNQTDKWYYRYCHFFNVIFFNIATCLDLKVKQLFISVILCNLILQGSMISYCSNSSTKISHISITAPSGAIKKVFDDSGHFPVMH